MKGSRILRIQLDPQTWEYLRRRLCPVPAQPPRRMGWENIIATVVEEWVALDRIDQNEGSDHADPEA